VLSVSRLNERARALLETAMASVWVAGEVSNLARPSSGHIYFSLKDAHAQVRCAMFRARGRALVPDLREGMQVLAHGRVSLYAPRGDFQLIVETLEAAGEGALRLRFEELKRRLAAEGLFEQGRKRDLPDWPRAVGVVTSPSGAAVHDIITVLGRRCAALPIIIYPTLVQGEGAARAIADAIATANRRAECDVLIVGRGGGSLEDLWAFNEEIVARAIYSSTLPVVSAVGHEVDVTIADLVADVRAPTPSAAAELVSPDVAELAQRLRTYAQRLPRAALTLRDRLARELEHLNRRLVSPRRRLEQHFQRVDELGQRLPKALHSRLAFARTRLLALRARLIAQAPSARVAALRERLHRIVAQLNERSLRRIERRQARVERARQVLHAIGPGATLERGYAIVTGSSGQVLRDASLLTIGDAVTTRLARGAFTSTVAHIAPQPAADDDGSGNG